MESTPEWLGIVVVLAPLVIFILVMLVIRLRLADQRVSLADLLVETEVAVRDNQKDNAGNAQQADDPNPKPPVVKRSASRLILFLSGVTSLILGVCITMYYFYMNIYCIACQQGLALDDFTNILLALGIGVVPYAVNQVKRVKL